MSASAGTDYLVTAAARSGDYWTSVPGQVAENPESSATGVATAIPVLAPSVLGTRLVVYAARSHSS